MNEYRWARPVDIPHQGWRPVRVETSLGETWVDDYAREGSSLAAEYEIGPPLVLPPALRAPDRDHAHRSERDSEHRYDSTGTVVKSEHCSCGAIRQARLSQDQQLKLGDGARRSAVEFGAWVRP